MKTRIAYKFDALITLLPTDLGGRQGAAFTGYRPNLNFNTDQYFCSEVRFADSQESMAPGETTVATIAMLPAKHIRRNIGPGDSFTLTEGMRVVGTGIVRKVLEREEVSDVAEVV